MNLNFQLPGLAQVCALCDKSLMSEDPDVFVEKQYIDQSNISNIYLVRIWHQDCYHQYLDQGEQV
jgi:hypothetical protein